MSNIVELDGFSITNSFKTDCKGKGQFAENDFIKYFYTKNPNNNKTLLDVRDIPEYQKIDVDFIIDRHGGTKIPSVKESLFNEERYIKIEVKFNSPALRTNKLAYEVVSHSSRGWGITSKCDFFYMVFGEEVSNGEYIIKKRAFISLKRWQDFIDDKTNRRELYYNKGENGIVNIMTFLDDMERKNVLRYINFE